MAKRGRDEIGEEGSQRLLTDEVSAKIPPLNVIDPFHEVCEGGPLALDTT